MKPHDQQGEAGDNDDFGLERQSRMKRAFFKETYGALLHRGLKGEVKDFYTLCKKTDLLYNDFPFLDRAKANHLIMIREVSSTYIDQMMVTLVHPGEQFTKFVLISLNINQT